MPDLSERDLDWLRSHEADVEKARKKLEERAHKLGVRISDLRDERQSTRKHAAAKGERERELEKAIHQAKLHALWTKHGCIDTCSTWLGLRLVVLAVRAKTDWAGTVNAADRTEAHVDDCGDHQSQAELYYGWTHHLPNFYPANPPGTGSHEGFVDPTMSNIGFGAVGSHLKPWQWGVDLGDGPEFETYGRGLGFDIVRPYSNESWHCNLRSDPTPVLVKLGVV